MGAQLTPEEEAAVAAEQIRLEQEQAAVAPAPAPAEPGFLQQMMSAIGLGG
jgi:hypothetical protein